MTSKPSAAALRANFVIAAGSMSQMPQRVDPEQRPEAERLELRLRAGADQRHHRASPGGARYRAAIAEVAAVRSAVRIVISASEHAGSR